jgi:hypothetical protein
LGHIPGTIEDHVDTCADYLGRLRRSLAGEIAPDRHYFAEKAHQLHTAARRMVRIVQDVDRWLAECGTTVEHRDADGTRFIGECMLPGGHQGVAWHGRPRHLHGPVSSRTTTAGARTSPPRTSI